MVFHKIACNTCLNTYLVLANFALILRTMGYSYSSNNLFIIFQTLMNAQSGRMVVVRMVSVQTLLDRTRVNVTQATPETDLLAQVSVGYCESACTLACTLKHCCGFSIKSVLSKEASIVIKVTLFLS